MIVLLMVRRDDRPGLCLTGDATVRDRMGRGDVEAVDRLEPVPAEKVDERARGQQLVVDLCFNELDAGHDSARHGTQPGLVLGEREVGDDEVASRPQCAEDVGGDPVEVPALVHGHVDQRHVEGRLVIEVLERGPVQRRTLVHSGVPECCLRLP
jgi:hypothetical protein